MASRSTIDSLWPLSWRNASMLISTWVGRPRSVTKTGSSRAARLAWLTSWLNSRLPISFTIRLDSCLGAYNDSVVM